MSHITRILNRNQDVKSPDIAAIIIDISGDISCSNKPIEILTEILRQQSSKSESGNNGKRPSS